ncbi:MAG: sulfite exporter TauE/SafE family protein [Dehalococcoidia bacterium]|nr:sulfite exporter TauE/SafE family protein [Dehalococcoidia bacterium]
MTTVGLGFLLGFLIGLTGVGGGALVAPALYVILGLTYQDSVALSLVYSVFTKIVGAIQHMRQGTVLGKITLVYALTGIPGAVLGSGAVYWAGGTAQRVFPFLMGGVLIVVAGLILAESAIRSRSSLPKPFSPHRITVGGIIAIGAFQLVVGTLLGITSVGSGSLVIVSMLYLFRMSAKEIVGSNIVIALVMVIPAGITHYATAGVDWPVLGLLTIGSLVGAVLGARATLIVPERVLTFAIAALIALGAVSTIVKASEPWTWHK